MWSVFSASAGGREKYQNYQPSCRSQKQICRSQMLPKSSCWFLPTFTPYFSNTHSCDKKGGKPLQSKLCFWAQWPPQTSVPELSTPQILIYQNFWKMTEIQVIQHHSGQENCERLLRSKRPTSFLLHIKNSDHFLVFHCTISQRSCLLSQEWFIFTCIKDSI